MPTGAHSSRHGRQAGLLLLVLSCCIALIGCSALAPARPKVFQMGDRVEAGTLIYMVLEAEWHAQLGEGPQARIPRNRFLALRVTVTNSGATDCDVPAMRLVDSGGHAYPELTAGEDLPEWLGVLRRPKPAETMRGRVLFDVPQADYQLRVADETLIPE